jgi:predicted Rossmann fold nucleotide-binding protein DprA/Smf involved in DNA uptake
MTVDVVPSQMLDVWPVLHRFLGEETPQELHMLGNQTFLQNRLLAFFCSQRCPGSVLAKMYDLAQILSQQSITVVGGFQSPVEQEFLFRLLRSALSVIVCPARNLETMRLLAEFEEPLQQGRLLLLSPFSASVQRLSRTLAVERNRFVAALADRILIAHASPGGALESLCRELNGANKKMFTLQDDANQGLVDKGCAAMVLPEITTLWN